MDPTMNEDEQAPQGMVEQAAEGPEPPEDSPPDVAEDRAEGEIEGRGGVEDEEGGGAALADQARASLQQHIPPELQAPVERLVVAGMKVMFDPQTHDLAMQEVTRSKDGPAAGAAVGVAALMSQLVMRSKGQMPQPAIVPAANILLVEALAFLDEAGTAPLTPESLSEATADLAGYLMQKLGMTPEKVAQSQQLMKQQGGGAPAPEQDMQDMPPQAPPAGPRGLIDQQMGV